MIQETQEGQTHVCKACVWNTNVTEGHEGIRTDHTCVFKPEYSEVADEGDFPPLAM